MTGTLSTLNNRRTRPSKFFRKNYNQLGLRYWVIEALETPVRSPHFLLGVSKGRCFILWDDDIQHAKKFSSELQAYKWARDNRLLCGFRIVMRLTPTTKET